MTNHLPLLVFNCHEAWVHQLESLDLHLHIIDGLPGRYCSRWNEGVRPVPRNSILVKLEEVLRNRTPYQCVISHNITDLLDCKTLSAPRILVLHSTLEGRMRQHGDGANPEQLKRGLKDYVSWVGGHVVAVSQLKGRSWGLTEDVVEFGVEVSQYRRYSGDFAAGLRISNQIHNRREILYWDFHKAAFEDIPVRLVGFNPEIPGVFPSRTWEDLKFTLSSHRFYIHTAHPELEDGYNMATLEAMASGLPVLGNRHPSSPIEHGISGFLSNDPRELNRYARLLLDNKELAGRMGEAARRKAAEAFSVERFTLRFQGSITKAFRKWPKRKAPPSYFNACPPAADPDCGPRALSIFHPA